VTQRKLFDFPSETVKPNPEARVIRSPGKGIIDYTPKRRDLPEVAVVSEEEVDKAKEMRRREIEYHKMRIER